MTEFALYGTRSDARRGRETLGPTRELHESATSEGATTFTNLKLVPGIRTKGKRTNMSLWLWLLWGEKEKKKKKKCPT